jgi:hypothetical protein
MMVESLVTYVNSFNIKTKAKYNSYERECLVIVWVVLSFQCYIYGNTFILVTNYHTFKFLIKSNQLIKKLVDVNSR